MHRARLPPSSSSLSGSSKHKKRPLGFYEKALPPRNPRYAHVASRIDSGPTVAKVRTVTTRQFVKRKAEAFARVTPSQLAALAAEYAEEGGGWEENEEEDDAALAPSAVGSSSVVVVTHDPTREAPAYDKPFLLLDARPEAEAFERTRLVEGVFQILGIGGAADRYTTTLYTHSPAPAPTPAAPGPPPARAPPLRAYKPTSPWGRCPRPLRSPVHRLHTHTHTHTHTAEEPGGHAPDPVRPRRRGARPGGGDGDGAGAAGVGECLRALGG